MEQKVNILEIRGISKSFGAVHALKGVSFNVQKGEIHTLLGENGAGKSTLIKILSGEHAPDAGEIFIDGKKIKHFHPLISHACGISIVHQELSIFENLTVYENVFPYREGKRVRIPRKELIENVRKQAKRFDFDIDPTAKMGDLRLSVQQMVEILRALSDEAKIILLDEPTSGLNTQETENLMRILKRLRDDGISIIYISHRISEIMEISDRITVLRDGEYINTFKNDHELTENTLISSMVGRDFTASIYSKKQSNVPADAPIYFRAEGFSTGTTVSDVSLSVRKGEIMGVFGLEGSGTYEFSRMLFGLHSKEKGKLYIRDQEVRNISPQALMEKGVVFLNNNRKDAGLLFEMSIAENLSAPILDRLSKCGMIRRASVEEHALQYAKKFSIVLDSIYDKPSSLSGGNQQKVMLSICLGTQPDILIVNEPTRGIDVGAKQEILRVLEDLAESGLTILCFSSDLPELITLSDRIMVMNCGKMAGIIECDEISENSVMALAAR